MNNKGETNILKDPVVYLILIVIFFVGMLFFVLQYEAGGIVWEDYYAKEIVKIIDFSKPGDKIEIDVHKATEIAKDNEVSSFSEIFQVNNKDKEVCVKLSKGRKTCYSYFNDVDVVNLELKLAEGKNEDNKEVNVLGFEIIGMQEARNVS